MNKKEKEAERSEIDVSGSLVYCNVMFVYTKLIRAVLFLTPFRLKTYNKKVRSLNVLQKQKTENVKKLKKDDENVLAKLR